MQRYHQHRQEEQQARLRAAYEQLERQGGRITRDLLVMTAHADNRAASTFLKERRAERGPLPLSTEQRLEQGYSLLVARGECLSIPRLKAVAHVGQNVARRFLRSRGIAPQWGKGKPQKVNEANAKAEIVSLIVR